MRKNEIKTLEAVIISYNILLTGQNTALNEDFFIQMDEKFICLTSSSRYADIENHLKFFNADALVYCLYNEARETINRIGMVKNFLAMRNIPFIIVGDLEDCTDFNRIAPEIADLTLTRPMKASAIEGKMISYIVDNHRLQKAREDKAREAREQEELRAKKEQEVLVDRDELERLLMEQLEEQEVRKHVLVVDDDVRMLKVIKEHLHEKYDVATAVSGKLALRFLEKKKTDLVILDYEMPGEDGASVLAQIREAGETKNLPVIFLTGVTDKDRIAKILGLKPQGYLLKPIEKEKLLDAVSPILG